MKTNNTVIELIERAQARAEKAADSIGIATKNKRERYYNWGGDVTVGDMVEVYRVTYSQGGLGGDIARLYHYDTLTAEVWVSSPASILSIYGESRSDADSVNTFLSYFDIDARYTYKPVNGGFQEVN